MTYSFIVEVKPTYLHAKGQGEMTEINARQLLIDAYQACVEHNMDRLLVEMCFTGKSLSFGSVYSVIADRSRDGSMLKSIAYVDNNSAHAGDIAEFAETVAVNRGVNVRLFESVAAAERWLHDEAAKSSSRDPNRATAGSLGWHLVPSSYDSPIEAHNAAMSAASPPTRFVHASSYPLHIGLRK